MTEVWRQNGGEQGSYFETAWNWGSKTHGQDTGGAQMPEMEEVKN